MKYYYHLTTQENAEKILQNGLQPMVGVNSQSVGDLEPKIYLTKRKYIPFWQKMIDNPIVLKIDADGINPECAKDFSYGLYKEVIYDETIDKKYISSCDKTFELSDKQMKEFCLAMIDTISNICVSFAIYISYKDDKELLAKYQNKEYINYKKEYVMKSVPNFNKIIKNLDFSVLKSKDVRKHLKARGEDSAFTLCDSYNYKSFDATNPRLWELLGTHDAATDDTKWLYNWLKSTYPKCLDVDTGGWTG